MAHGGHAGHVGIHWAAKAPGLKLRTIGQRTLYDRWRDI